VRTAAWLLTYAATLGWVVDPMLARSRWLRRYPAAGLWLWHGVALGTVAALAAGLFLLAHDVAEHGFVWGLNADKALVHDAYASPNEVPAMWNVSLVPLIAGLGLLGISAVRRWRTARKESLVHRLGVEFRRPVTAAGGRKLFVGIHRSPVPAIYCVARGSDDQRILATTGALRVLDEQQLAAAVEHERAHVVGHHHAMKALSQAVRSVSRWLGMLRNYPCTVRTLMELHADDVAARHHGSRTVAAALLQIGAAGTSSAPPTAASLGGDDLADRIRRLLNRDANRGGGAASVIAIGAATALFAVPVLCSLIPAMSLAGTARTSHEDPPSPTPAFAHHP